PSHCSVGVSPTNYAWTGMSKPLYRRRPADEPCLDRNVQATRGWDSLIQAHKSAGCLERPHAIGYNPCR
ncbi:MAG: hypothetical protein P3X24_003770, partial [bacterium]|nr:hypothetical protein [bacterium]